MSWASSCGPSGLEWGVGVSSMAGVWNLTWDQLGGRCGHSLVMGKGLKPARWRAANPDQVSIDDSIIMIPGDELPRFVHCHDCLFDLKSSMPCNIPSGEGFSAHTSGSKSSVSLK